MALHIKPKDENSFTAIRKYESCLGRGAFGMVLRAISSSDSIMETRTTAVKFLFSTDTNNERVSQQILRESTLTRELVKHENVVQIIHVVNKELTATELRNIFSDDILQNEEERQQRDAYEGTAKRFNVIQTVCIQMELCGENLRKWLAAYMDLDPNDVCLQLQQMIITKNIMAGLKFLHDNNIIHRDLKPENIMFSSENFCLPVKIGDFGLCRKLPPEGTLTGPLTSYVGTRFYMAPEILAGSKDYSYQADLYSLGLIIWEVLQFVNVTLFYQLVFDNEDGLVKKHPLMGGVKEVIIGLTKRKAGDRIKGLGDLVEFYDSLELKDFPNMHELYVRSSIELNLCLKYAKSGWAIMLTGGNFVGPFVLKQNKVSIRGVVGGGTVIECSNSTCLQVLGNDCNISDIKMIARETVGIQLAGSRNSIKSVEFSGRDCIVVDGDENRLKDLSFFQCIKGIIIQGLKNCIDNAKLTSIEQFGIIVALDSNGNSISNISGSNVTLGIAVHGSKNHLSNINFTKNNDRHCFRGIELFPSGSNNTVQNFVCSGYIVGKQDWGLRICSNNSAVSESKCGPVYVTGSNNALKNVDCGELTTVEGDAEGLCITKCTGIRIILETALVNVTLLECNYYKDTNSAPLLNRVVRNGDELRMRLQSAENGSVIVLGEGVYIGPFVLKQDNVTLVGQGPAGTIIKFLDWLDVNTCFQVVGNGCCISDLKIVPTGQHGIKLTGSGNTVKNVHFIPAGGVWGSCVELQGDENKLYNLKIYTGHTAIRLKGCRNIVNNILFNNVKIGISCHENSNENSISNINGGDVELLGINISGSNNNLSNVTLDNNQWLKVRTTGVRLSGFKNTVQNLTCYGYTYSSSKVDWGLEIYSRNSSVKDSKCGPILVHENNVRFRNVMSDEVIRVHRSAIGTEMIECSGKRLEASENVTLTDCNFKTQTTDYLEVNVVF